MPDSITPPPSYIKWLTDEHPNRIQLLTFAITLSLLLSISLAILLRNLVQRARERRIREVSLIATFTVPFVLMHPVGRRGWSHSAGFAHLDLALTAWTLGSWSLGWRRWRRGSEYTKTCWPAARIMGFVAWRRWRREGTCCATRQRSRCLGWNNCMFHPFAHLLCI